MLKRHTVVITGVSSGIGKGTAQVLLRAGFRVYGSVRSHEQGEELRRQWGEAFVPLYFDVTDEIAVRAAAEEVRRSLNGELLSGLVNNAGIVVPGPVLSQSKADFELQVAVNLTGIFIVTQAFLPLLGAEAGRFGEAGRVVNISSVGGKIAAPFIAGYAASKHAVEGFSESLRRELCLFGIKVVVIGPGATDTLIWDKGKTASPDKTGPYSESMRAFQTYSEQLSGSGFPPEKVGQVILRALTVRTPKLRYAVVPGRFLNWTLPRLLPRWIVDALMARLFKLERHRGISQSPCHTV